MLSYLQRTIPSLARALLGRDGALVSRIDRRVKFRDLDYNLHMNQAVYAQVLELGRTDWIIRSGALARWREQGLMPVVASQRIVYRRELRLGTRYSIDTRCVGVRGRLLMVQGHIIVGERVHALSEAELIFRGPERVLDAEEVERCCEGLLAPELAVEDWVVTA